MALLVSSFSYGEILLYASSTLEKPLSDSICVLLNQPVSVVFDAGGRDFQFYSSEAVFMGRCGTQQNHDFTTVGYGLADEGDYWRVKNSWGEEGYISMRRGVDAVEGLCSIVMRASYLQYKPI